VDPLSNPTLHVPEDIEPPSESRAMTLAAIVVPLALTLALIGAIAFATTQFGRPAAQQVISAPQWQPYVEAAKRFSVQLMSIDVRSADADIQRILSQSTGDFRDNFISRRSDFLEAVRDNQVTSDATVKGAGLESIDGTTAQVLVAVSSRLTDSTGTTRDPRLWRLRMHVVQADQAYKISTVEFVQ
jgi:serine/threonine protein kinase, bacterial